MKKGKRFAQSRPTHTHAPTRRRCRTQLSSASDRKPPDARKGRARAVLSSDLSGDHHAANGRDQELNRHARVARRDSGIGSAAPPLLFTRFSVLACRARARARAWRLAYLSFRRLSVPFSTRPGRVLLIVILYGTRVRVRAFFTVSRRSPRVGSRIRGTRQKTPPRRTTQLRRRRPAPAATGAAWQAGRAAAICRTAHARRHPARPPRRATCGER